MLFYAIVYRNKRISVRAYSDDPYLSDIWIARARVNMNVETVYPPFEAANEAEAVAFIEKWEALIAA